MSQTDLGLDPTYIVSSNGDYHGDKIVVSVLSDTPPVTSHAHHVVPIQMVSNHSLEHQYISNTATISNVQHLQATDQGLAQTDQSAVDEHNATVIEVNQICENEKSNSSAEEESSGRATGVSWPKKAVLKLITLHKEHQNLFDNSQYKKKSIWEMIARKMKEGKMNYSWSQVENKWKSLTKRFRDTVDYNARNNSVMLHSCPFYDEIFQAYPYVSPHIGGLSPFTALPNTSIPVKRALDVGGVSEADVASLTKKKKYANSNQSASMATSSAGGAASTSVVSTSMGNQAPDLGVLLRSIHEDRKRLDKVKMDRLERMHKEKMDLFKQFLDVVKSMKPNE